MYSIEFDIKINQRNHKKHNISGCPHNKGPENLSLADFSASGLRLDRSKGM